MVDETPSVLANRNAVKFPVALGFNHFAVGMSVPQHQTEFSGFQTTLLGEFAYLLACFCSSGANVVCDGVFVDATISHFAFERRLVGVHQRDPCTRHQHGGLFQSAR